MWVFLHVWVFVHMLLCVCFVVVFWHWLFGIIKFSPNSLWVFRSISLQATNSVAQRVPRKPASSCRPGRHNHKTTESSYLRAHFPGMVPIACFFRASFLFKVFIVPGGVLVCTKFWRLIFRHDTIYMPIFSK